MAASLPYNPLCMVRFAVPREIYWWGPRREVDLDDPGQRAWLIALLVRAGRELDVVAHLAEWDRAELRRALAEQYVPDHLRQLWEAVLAVEEEAILTREQEEVIGLVAACPTSSLFALAGGTALAAHYLHHRRSEDLDFFTWDRGACEAIFAEFTDLLERRQIPLSPAAEQGTTHKRALVGTSRVKVEFAYDGAFRINPDRPARWGIRIESLEDIAAGKMGALFGRAEPRDFVDVFFLAERMSREELLRLAKLKDPGFDRYWFARACAQVEKVDFGEVAMLKQARPEEIRGFFRRWAEELLSELLGPERHRPAPDREDTR